MADTETVIASVAGALTILAQVAQGLYAKRKGKQREPQMKKLLDCTEHVDQAVEKLALRFERIEARLQRIEVAMAKSGISDPDDHPDPMDSP